jgi:hypothetical protein
MDLWVLPITPDAINAINQEKLRTSQGHDLVSAQSRAGPCMARAPQFPVSTTPQAKDMDIVMFTHSIRTRANAVTFSHQSMCNPKISSLMKALQKGYLKGCPNLSKELVTKYLNPSPATAKGHMERPKKGIRSTKKQVKTKSDSNVSSIPMPVPQAAPHPLPLFAEPIPYNGPAYSACTEVNYIPDDESIENLFCFGAFANKVSGVVYNDLTGNFPFMSINGSAAFLPHIRRYPRPWRQRDTNTNQR